MCSTTSPSYCATTTTIKKTRAIRGSRSVPITEPRCTIRPPASASAVSCNYYWCCALLSLQYFQVSLSQHVQYLFPVPPIPRMWRTKRRDPNRWRTSSGRQWVPLDGKAKLLQQVLLRRNADQWSLRSDCCPLRKRVRPVDMVVMKKKRPRIDHSIQSGSI